MKRRSTSSCGVNQIPETSSLSQGTRMPLRATRSSTTAQQKKKLDYTKETKKIVKKSKTTSENYTLDKDEFGIDRHVGEDNKIGKNANEMDEAGEEVQPPTELVLKNHTDKDEPLVDKQTTVLVTTVENLARQQSTSDESDAVSETGSTATGPSRHQPNAAYLETDSPFNGCIYGFELIQYHNVDTNKSEATSLCQSLNMDVRMTRLEEIMETLNRDLAGLKGDFAELKGDLAELKRGMDAILRVYGIDPVTLQPMDPSAKSPGS